MNKRHIIRIRPPLILTVLFLVGSFFSTWAQEVSIPDPGLDAAIRTALNKPTGPLTETDLLSLTSLNAGNRNITNAAGLDAARNLMGLLLYDNHLTDFSLPGGLTNLAFLDLSGNQLTSVTLPAGLTNLSTLFLNDNQLINVSLPIGLTKLNFLRLDGNQLTNITLLPDMMNLAGLFLNGNPLTTFVLSEPLAATTLAAVVTNLQNQGIPVFTYPLTVRLALPQQQLIGAFRFGITGPPGVYAVYSSSNLTAWDALNFVNNPLGGIFFTDTAAHLSPQKFYHALLQTSPTNMVFIPANAFIMGSPTNELHRDVNESPQTTVLLTRGYWIGKYEVTQGEYLSVMNTNPSTFAGDLSRPVSSVSWPDATNYCWLLTQRELAAGRISPGSKYRLPTEAEWECAARAGTTTRFSYGDDLDYSNLTNHAWFWMNSGFTVHPVGQKLPNPWGLYDMEGNVWEWCQDWLGVLPGGVVTDPQGPVTNPIGWKVIRGGGYDFGESDCRSARRFFFGNHPALNDSNLGFRVVLVMD